MALTLLYALGKYTPVFHLIYDFVPGVTLYRRPADATFVFCALLALLAGYLVHRLLTDTVPPPRPMAARGRDCRSPLRSSAIAIGLALWVGVLQSAALPILWGVGFAAAAIAALALARRLAARSALAAAAVLAVFSVADLGWNNAPNELTGLKPSQYEALRPDTTDETVTLLKAQAQGRRRARPPRPRRTDRRRPITGRTSG